MHYSDESGLYTAVCCERYTCTVWMERLDPQAHGADTAHNHSADAAYIVYHWTSTMACCQVESSVCSFPHTFPSQLSCITIKESIPTSANKVAASTTWHDDWEMAQISLQWQTRDRSNSIKRRIVAPKIHAMCKPTGHAHVCPTPKLPFPGGPWRTPSYTRTRLRSFACLLTAAVC